MADLKMDTHPLRAGMPGAKPLRCLDPTAVPKTREEAGRWISDDAGVLGVRRGLLGDALRDALPDLCKEIMNERSDWLMIYHKGVQAREYTPPPAGRPIPTSGPVQEWLSLNGYRGFIDDFGRADIQLIEALNAWTEAVLKHRQDEVAALARQRRGG